MLTVLQHFLLCTHTVHTIIGLCNICQNAAKPLMENQSIYNKKCNVQISPLTVLRASFSIFVYWKFAVHGLHNLRPCTGFLFPAVYLMVYILFPLANYHPLINNLHRTARGGGVGMYIKKIFHSKYYLNFQFLWSGFLNQFLLRYL